MIEIVIKIDDRLYSRIKYLEPKADTMLDELMRSIQSGTPLPEHHGDLIDRNELLDESYQIDSMYCEYDEVVNVDDIKDAPTIIEGSDSK